MLATWNWSKPMNDHEMTRIAAAMHEMRPDWPTSSLLTLMRKNLADKPRRDVAVAFAWVACEPNTHTPARVLEAGPWWRAAGIEGAAKTREPFDHETFCSTCGKPDVRHHGDHEFVSVLAHTRTLAREAEMVAEKREAALAEARAAIRSTRLPEAEESA